MTQRSILAGQHPSITIHAGASVIVRGVEGERVIVSASDWGGVKLESSHGDVKVKLGFNGQVEVPFQSNVRVYAGLDGQVEGVSGDVGVVAGKNLVIRAAGRLTAASAGWTADIDCEKLSGEDIKLQAGRDLRLAVYSLPGARIRVTDLGGRWEGVIGDGRFRLTIVAGGDAILITDQPVSGVPPDYILGHIEKPAR
jgi:hypothetical protein